MLSRSVFARYLLVAIVSAFVAMATRVIKTRM